MALTTSQVLDQVQRIQEIMAKVMKDNEHYGSIAGFGNKKVLLKPGAEKLILTFRLAPDFEITDIDMGSGHREYRIKCIIRSQNGNILGAGVGSGSTMESKYRYRNISGFEITGDAIPDDFKNKKEIYRKQGYGCKQVSGKWEWVKYTESGKTENADIADTYNTVLKMAKKRALVDAVLTVTAASDIFTQDLEENLAADENTVPSATKTIRTEAQNFSASKISEDAKSVLKQMMDDMGWTSKKQWAVFQSAEIKGEKAALDGVGKEYEKFCSAKAAAAAAIGSESTNQEAEIENPY